MIYQLTWKILPGLRGLSCSDFRAVPTNLPNNEQGVVLECASEAECENFVRQLERDFDGQRYANQAAAFEAVKGRVLDWAARGRGKA